MTEQKDFPEGFFPKEEARSASEILASPPPPEEPVSIPDPEPQVVAEPDPEPEGAKRSDEPLTGDEIKEAATGLYTHAKEVWLQPVRKEVRSWFRAGREFLDSLGSDR